jgi:hypothetical protein
MPARRIEVGGRLRPRRAAGAAAQESRTRPDRADAEDAAAWRDFRQLCLLSGHGCSYLIFGARGPDRMLSLHIERVGVGLNKGAIDSATKVFLRKDQNPKSFGSLDIRGNLRLHL